MIYDTLFQKTEEVQSITKTEIKKGILKTRKY